MTSNASFDFSVSTDALRSPIGNTAQRPTSAAPGDFRFNTDTVGFEGYTTKWGPIGERCERPDDGD